MLMLDPELLVRVKVKTTLPPSPTVTFGLLGVSVTPDGVAMAQAGQRSTKLNKHAIRVSRELLNMSISSKKFCNSERDAKNDRLWVRLRQTQALSQDLFTIASTQRANASVPFCIVPKGLSVAYEDVRDTSCIAFD